jgi:peptidoglycan DL-endopeptidase CwlO
MKQKIYLVSVLFLLGIGVLTLCFVLNTNEKQEEQKKLQIAETGKVWIDKSEYVVGAGRNEADINAGHFDTSSFVHWVFKQQGIDLGPLNSVSTETLKDMGKKVDVSEIQPGDLIFWDTHKKDGHVGVYIGDNKWIGCQFAGGVQVIPMSNSYWEQKFDGHVRRVIF